MEMSHFSQTTMNTEVIMRTFVILLIATIFVAVVSIRVVTSRLDQADNKIEILESKFHTLNKRLLILEHPNLVRPFNRDLWEGQKSTLEN